MLGRLRIIVFFAIAIAVAIGLLLPNPWKKTPETAQVSQVPQLSIN